MTDFLFPTNISYGAEGGPEYSTDIVIVQSGHEIRNENWSESSYRFDAATGIQSEADLYALLDFFHTCSGRAYAFKFKDWGDYKSCGPHLTVTGDDCIVEDDATAGQTTVQLRKEYTSGPMPKYRTIYKPIASTVIIKVNNVLLPLNGESGPNYSVNESTGIVTFTSLLGLHDVVKAGFEFYIYARFDTDRLSRRFIDYQIGEASVPIVGVRI